MIEEPVEDPGTTADLTPTPTILIEPPSPASTSSLPATVTQRRSRNDIASKVNAYFASQNKKKRCTLCRTDLSEKSSLTTMKQYRLRQCNQKGKTLKLNTL